MTEEEPVGAEVRTDPGSGSVAVAPVARALVDALLDVAGDRIDAVLLFGSQLVGAAPSRFSAYDMVVLVDAYRPFYERLVEAGHHRRSAQLLAGLSGVLPPNVIAFMPDLPGDQIAKAMVVTPDDFERALGPDARDHFLKGRMVQRVGLVHARDEAAGRRVRAALAGARRDVLRWVGPYLEAPFDAEKLARRMLEVSYAGEVRPEVGERVTEVFEAQRDFLVESYARVLREAEERGEVERVEEEGFRWTDSAPRASRLAMRLYFVRSKVRATARWLKHVVTFDDWLTYIQRKVERRTGMRVEITSLERKYPLVFLWPKVFGVLRALSKEEDDGGDPTSRREGTAAADAGSATGEGPS